MGGGRAGPKWRVFGFTERFSTMIRMNIRNIAPESSATWQEETPKDEVGWRFWNP
jgi:hypothetical protein